MALCVCVRVSLLISFPAGPDWGLQAHVSWTWSSRGPGTETDHPLVSAGPALRHTCIMLRKTASAAIRIRSTFTDFFFLNTYKIRREIIFISKGRPAKMKDQSKQSYWKRNKSPKWRRIAWHGLPSSFICLPRIEWNGIPSPQALL